MARSPSRDEATASARARLFRALSGPLHPVQCPKHGTRDAVGPGNQCPACHVEELQQTAQADAAVARASAERDALEAAVGHLDIPKRFADASFESFRVGNLCYRERDPRDPVSCQDCGNVEVDRALGRSRCAVCAARRCEAACRRYAAGFQKVRERGTNLLLVGTTGTGKTHLACAIARYLHSAGHAVSYRNISEISRRIRASYNRRDGPDEATMLAGFAALDLLILDEIGVQSGSDHELMILTEIINARSAEKRPTLCVSNLPPAELRNVLGERILSRLNASGSLVLVMDWIDQRSVHA